MARRRVLPDLVARLRLDASGFDNRLKSIESDLAKIDKSTEQTGDRLDRLGKRAGISGSALKAGLLGGAGAAVAIGTDLAKTGIALEAMNAKAEKVFGSEIESVRQWAKENAISMGLTRREAVGLAAGLSDLLVPMGFARKEAADMSQRVIGLSGALAAWSGGQRTAAEVAGILQSAMLGEREQLKGLGISITEADISQRLLEKGQRNLTGAALQQAEALATVELIYAKSKDAQDAYNDSTKTTAERMTAAQAKFRDAKEELATGFLPVLTTAAEKAGELATNLNEAFKPRDQNPGRKSNFALGLDTIKETVPIGLTEKEVERIRSGKTGSGGAPGVLEALQIGKALEKLASLLGADDKVVDRLAGGTVNQTNNFNGITDERALAAEMNRELDWASRAARTRAGSGGRGRS